MIFKKFRKWLRETSAVAAIESMFIFPVLMTMLFGIVDVGTGIIINTKVIS
ncbi:MAG: TadE/TadG family type IV pilus assembly protein, partial [Pseudomonadota bacterium]